MTFRVLWSVPSRLPEDASHDVLRTRSMSSGANGLTMPWSREQELPKAEVAP